jgi:hypothetical protein
MRNINKIYALNYESKRPLGRSRYSWEDSIKMYLKETARKCVDWIHLTQQTHRITGI